jgi:hypothetical protein
MSSTHAICALQGFVRAQHNRPEKTGDQSRARISLVKDDTFRANIEPVFDFWPTQGSAT